MQSFVAYATKDCIAFSQAFVQSRPVQPKTEDARKTFTQVVEQHANTPFAEQARQEIEKLKG